MGMCKGCGEVFSALDMNDGYCKNCFTVDMANSIAINIEREEQFKNNKSLSDQIIVTTEMTIDMPIEQRMGIVSSQCVYGLNIIKDLFAFVRDIVGGRINSIESALDTASKEVINELKTKAFLMGGNAVIGVKIEHTYNNSSNGNILSVYATGTVIKIRSENE